MLTARREGPGGSVELGRIELPPLPCEGSTLPDCAIAPSDTGVELRTLELRTSSMPWKRSPS